MRVSHLFLGTQHDNVQDALRKNRLSRGESHPASRLTELKVKTMRKEGIGVSLRELAEKYGVSRQQVLNVLKRKHWRHVPDAP